MPVLSVIMNTAELWGYRLHNTNPCKNTRRYENRLVGIETRLTGIEAKVSMLQWMVGLNLAVSLAIVVILFRSLGG